MGNVRTKDIKRAAFQLKEAYKDKFSGGFEKNKDAVKELGLIENKRMRNRVVGYLTRAMKRPE
ncbi:MAG: 30S ribosomal protein S17e [Candidatus Aenigmarchaeota archaeon]|nr:30S ribosomal protein S17e [Candidatus Aenigmarchaeota archaeon]